MDYESFLPDETKPVCNNVVRNALLYVSFFLILVDLGIAYVNHRKIVNLRKENTVLKGVILRGVDRALTNFLKNGSDPSNSDDE